LIALAGAVAACGADAEPIFDVAHLYSLLRATRNANEVIETKATMGERVADNVARLGG
jgi:hypothetical protein